MANSEGYMPSTRSQSGLTGQTASLTSRRSLSPGAAGCRLEYGLHELAMCTVMSVKVKEARRVTIESKPDTLGAHGSSWSTSVSTGSLRGKHGRHASSEFLSNTVLPSNISGKDFRKTCGPTFSPTRCSGSLDRGSAQWSTSSSTWNDSTFPMDDSQRLKAIDEMTSRSLRCTRAMANKLTSSGSKPYCRPVDQQTKFVEKLREQKLGSEEQRRYDDLVNTWGKDGADHLIYINELREAKQRKAADRMYTVRNALHHKSHQPKRTSKSDLEAVKALDEFSIGEETDQRAETAEDGEPDGEPVVASRGVAAGGLPAVAAAEDGPKNEGGHES